jgi:hypothetical protein
MTRGPAIAFGAGAVLLFAVVTPTILALWSCYPAAGPSCAEAFPRAFALVGVSLGLLALGVGLALIPHLLRRRAVSSRRTAAPSQRRTGRSRRRRRS